MLNKNPVEPFVVKGKGSLEDVLERMGKLSFQARQLGLSFKVWQRMLEDETFIFLGLAGAMVPAGMRKIVSFLIEKRLIDCLVSTGANLFHDLYETLGGKHYQGTPFVDDIKLKEEGVDRIYDTLAPEEGFRKADNFIAEFARTLDRNHSYTTREFIYYLGENLAKKGKEKGIITAAYEKKLPIYCPAIGDSSIGIALAADKVFLNFDVARDVYETAFLSGKAKRTGVIYIGGGTPKNFIQQTQVTLSLIGEEKGGHYYAIQIITDPPHWGGLSGCTLEEAQSWGKIAPEARKVTLYCDATVALPLLVEALALRLKEGFKRSFIPQFEMGKDIKITNI